MKLFLASEATNTETLKKLETYIGGLKGKRIAYIPTAANGQGRGSWKDGGSWNLLQTIDPRITLIELEDYFETSVIEKLEHQDIIWFGGGMCGYLMYWIRRTQLDKHLPRLLEQGTLYIGSSAGSMITAKTLDLAEMYIGEQEHGASVIPGLGLVNFEIYPHYEDDMYDQIKGNYTGKKLYLLKNGEEILVEDGKITVQGEERIIVDS